MNGHWRAADEERVGRVAPLELVRHPELLVEARDVAVRGEQVVVVALEPVAAADVERRRLAAEAGPALVDVDRVARPARAGARRSGRRRRRRGPRSSALASGAGGARGRRLVGSRFARLAHDVQRAALDLVVDAPDVLADHAERDQLDAAEQQDHDQRRGDARDEDAL